MVGQGLSFFTNVGTEMWAIVKKEESKIPEEPTTYNLLIKMWALLVGSLSSLSLRPTFLKENVLKRRKENVL